MNIAELAEHSAARMGEVMVLDYEGQQFTNWQLLDQARRLQRGFSRLGARQGDIITMCVINHPLVFSIFQGIFRCGCTALPVMFTLTEPEVRYILQDAQAQGIVTDTANLAKIRAAAGGFKHIRWIAVIGGQDDPAASPPEYRLETLLEETPQEVLPKIDEGDVALMMYTAGTTGRPKGVMLTHGNLYHSADAINEASELHLYKNPLVRISALPMAHIFGVGVMNAGYLASGPMSHGYLVQMHWFDPEKFMQLIQQHRCNSTTVVTIMLIFILNHPKVDEYDLSSLEEIVVGAGPLPVELALEVSKKYNCRCRPIFGQTECTGIGSADRLSLPYKPGSSGPAYYNMEIKIVDAHDTPVPVGVKGEIVLRGPCVMKGYFNNPEATADTLRGGWLHTGDIGYLDEDKCLFITDRLKDLIIKGGENIYPAELEEILYGMPGIAEAAVVGKPDPIYGESVIAYVVLKQGITLTEKEVKEFFRSKVSSFKAPSEVYFIDALPKSPVGKILKRELRERAIKDGK